MSLKKMKALVNIVVRDFIRSCDQFLPGMKATTFNFVSRNENLGDDCQFFGIFVFDSRISGLD